jgi:multidrug efflux pump subunit AcrA (membrane-fusion protein)
MFRSCSKGWVQSRRCIRPQRTQVTGTLEEVDFTEGQKVTSGQVLAKIDPRTLQAQLDQANATLGRDQAHLANAQLDLARYTLLARQHSAPQQQADTQRALVAQDEEVVKLDQAANMPIPNTAIRRWSRRLTVSPVFA